MPYYVCPHLVEPVNCIKNVTYFSGCVTKVIMCAYKQSKAKQSKAKQGKAKQSKAGWFAFALALRQSDLSPVLEMYCVNA